MKTKIFLTLSLTLVLQIVTSTAYSLTYLDITNLNGSEKKIDLGTLGKITFSGTDMVLNYLNGISEPIDITSVQKMVFNNATSIPKIETSEKISFYPNPVTSSIFLKNFPFGDLDISVFGLSGTIALKFRVPSTSGQIDVSSLPKGFYLLKVNNQVFKFSKI